MNGFRMISAAVCIFLCIAGSLGAVLVIRAGGSGSKKRSLTGTGSMILRITGKLYRRIYADLAMRFPDAGHIRSEISQGLMLMRNRIAVSESSRITTDLMLEELIEDSDRLRYPYSRMLSLIRTGEKRKAAEEFERLTGSRQAKEYARMMIMLDDLDPYDVDKSLASLQREMDEERITRLRKRDEALSDLLYIPVILDLLLIFFNFLYVGYFLQQKDLMAFLS